MASDPTVIEAHGVFEVTLEAATSCKAGDLIGFDGTHWVQADADARIAAEGVAMFAAAAGGAVKLARSGVLEDLDAPYTAGADQYLSATAGAHTATIPAASSTLTILQRVGRAVSTSVVQFDCARVGPTRMRIQAAVDPANAASDAIADLDVTLTGVVATDYVRPLPSSTIEAGVVCVAATAGADKVTLRLHNPTAGAVNGASKTWEFLVERF